MVLLREILVIIFQACFAGGMNIDLRVAYMQWVLTNIKKAYSILCKIREIMAEEVTRNSLDAEMRFFEK